MSLLAGVEANSPRAGSRCCCAWSARPTGRRSPPTGAGARKPASTASCCSTSPSTTPGRRCSTSSGWRSCCTAIARASRPGRCCCTTRGADAQSAGRPPRMARPPPRPAHAGPAEFEHERERRNAIARFAAGSTGMQADSAVRLLDGSRGTDRRGARGRPDCRHGGAPRTTSWRWRAGRPHPRRAGRCGARQLGRLAGVPPRHAAGDRARPVPRGAGQALHPNAAGRARRDPVDGAGDARSARPSELGGAVADRPTRLAGRDLRQVAVLRRS